MADAPTFWFDAMSKAVAPLQSQIAALQGRLAALEGPHPYTAAQIASVVGVVSALWLVYRAIKHGRAIAALQKGTPVMSENIDKVDAAVSSLKSSLQGAVGVIGDLRGQVVTLTKADADLTAKLQTAAADDAKLVTTVGNLGALKDAVDAAVSPPPPPLAKKA